MAAHIYRWMHAPSGRVGLVLDSREITAAHPGHVLFVPWHSLHMPEPRQQLTCEVLPAAQFRRVAIAPETPVSHDTPREIPT